MRSSFCIHFKGGGFDVESESESESEEEDDVAGVTIDVDSLRDVKGDRKLRKRAFEV